MNIIDTTATAWKSLTGNMGRSLLTVLGIVIGIVAIVLLMSVGASAQKYILNQVESIGAHTLIVRPGREPQGPTDVAETILSNSLTTRDLQYLTQPGRVPGLVSIQPVVLVPGAVTYQDLVSRPTIFGWTAQAIGQFFNIYPVQGDFFTDDDIASHAKVVVIGGKVKRDLFGDSNALGEYVKIHGQSLRVVGVLPASGQVSVLNLDQVAIVPYTVAQKDMLGIDHFFELFVASSPTSDVAEVADDLRATIRDLHGITDPKKDDFYITSQQDIVKRISTITQALTIFLVMIAAVSLLVGGVGIMNIMLVSVTERTREIGLRKALGATNTDILRQFLLEALMLTIGGGAVGVAGGVSLAYVASFVVEHGFGLSWPFILPWSAVFLGLGMSTIVGVAFGIYPARQAAKKNPIEALRYE